LAQAYGGTVTKQRALAMMWLVLIRAAACHAFLRTHGSLRDGAQVQARMKLHSSARMHSVAPNGDMLYGTVKVGTPPQEFMVAIDTSSGNLVLPNKHCLSQACMAHRLYDVDLSTSGHPLGTLDGLNSGGPPEHISLGFGRGSITGTFAHDTVCVGELCTALDFIMAEKMSDEPFNLVPYDGILGLGMPQMSTKKSFNLLGEYADDHALKHSQFSIWLARPADEGDSSELILGDMDPARLGSEMVWSRITTQPGEQYSGYWQFQLADITVGNSGIEACGSKGCQAVADTSTTTIGLPPAIFDLVNTQAPVRSDCSGVADLPKVGFLIDGFVLNLRPQDYVLKSSDGAACQTVFYPVTVPPPKGPVVLLGVPFLTAFYSVYDRESLKIGLALAAHKDVSTEEAATLFVRN